MLGMTLVGVRRKGLEMIVDIGAEVGGVNTVLENVYNQLGF